MVQPAKSLELREHVTGLPFAVVPDPSKGLYLH